MIRALLGTHKVAAIERNCDLVNGFTSPINRDNVKNALYLDTLSEDFLWLSLIFYSS